jgi:hypothetical protein
MSNISWITAAHEAIVLKYQADFIAAITRTDQKKVLKRVRKALQKAHLVVPSQYKRASSHTLPGLCSIHM